MTNIYNIATDVADINITFDIDTGILKFSPKPNINEDPDYKVRIPNYSLEATQFNAAIPWDTFIYVAGEPIFIKQKTKNIVIEEGIYEIGSYAFYGFSEVTYISLPNTLEAIGLNAFNLTPEQDSKLLLTLEFNGDIFTWCNINFNGYDQTTNMPAFKTNPLVLASKFMLKDNTGIVELNGKIKLDFYKGFTDKWDTDKWVPAKWVTVDDNSFKINNFALAGYSDLAKICFYEAGFYADNADTTAININSINIGDYAFYQCSSLEPVLDLPLIINEEGKPVYYNIGNNSFSNCTSLELVSLPESVLRLGNDVFEKPVDVEVSHLQCYVQLLQSPLLQVDDNITAGWDTLWDKSLEKSNIYLGFKRSGMTSDRILWKKSFKDEVSIIGYQGDAETLIIPCEIDGSIVTEICPNAFTGAHFTTLKIPTDNDLVIGKSAFSRCNTLIDVEFGNSSTLSNSEVSPVETGLTTITMEDFVFADCSKLASVKLTQIKHLGCGIFKGCNSLGLRTNNSDSPLSISDSQNFKVTPVYEGGGSTSDSILGYALCLELANETTVYHYFSTTDPDESNNETYIYFRNCHILDYACYGDTLTHVRLTGVKSIGKSAFEACTRLKEVLIDFSGALTLPIFYEGAFKDCVALTTVSLTDSTTGTELNDNDTYNTYNNTLLTNWCNITFKDTYANPLYYDAYYDGYATDYCDEEGSQNIATAYIPKSLWCKNTSTGDYATAVFVGGQIADIPDTADKLKSVTLTDIDCIPDCTFLSSYVEIIDIKYSNTDETDLKSLYIGDFAFAKSNISKVTVACNEDNSLIVNYVGRLAFYNTQFESLTIMPQALGQDPNQVDIKLHAFSNNLLLTSFKIKPYTCNLKIDNFICANNFALATLSVPAKLLTSIPLDTITALEIYDDGYILNNDFLQSAVKLNSLTVKNLSTTSKLLNKVTGLSFKFTPELTSITIEHQEQTENYLKQVIYMSVENCLLKRLDTTRAALIFGTDCPSTLIASDFGIDMIYQICDYAFLNTARPDTISFPEGVVRVGKNIFKD